MAPHLLRVLYLTFLWDYVSAYTPLPRWGQATALINEGLYVYGGKTDPENSYSYTSAPNQNDLLFLPLSSPFDTSSPPWESLSNATSTHSSNGPILAWHTLTPYNTSQALLFGGIPGPNSPTVLVDLADSAALLDISEQQNPEWTLEQQSWAGEPTRRIRHTASTSPSGRIYVVGGAKADGSGAGFATHYSFDITGPSFSPLPSANSPPDIYGHASILLTDGRLLIFGGYSPSQATLFPLSIVWVLDTTQSVLSWSLLQVSEGSLPTPRAAFAAVLLSDSRILIHGGSDASFQRNFEDGWILDVSRSPAVWSQVSTLSQVGARRDHFAISFGQQVIFGFGYGNDGPSTSDVMAYDFPSNAFVPSYTPPPLPLSTQTLPMPTQTPGSSYPHHPSGHPGSPGSPGSPGTTPMPPGSTPSSGGGNQGDKDKKNTTAIALGTTFGVLALVAGGLAVAYYAKHKRPSGGQAFVVLGGGRGSGDGEESLHLGGEIPAAGLTSEHGVGSAVRNGGLLHSIGLATVFRSATGRDYRTQRERRDMLADEDTRQFGAWYTSRRQSTDGSSWSLRNIISGRFPSREPSISSTFGVTPRREKTDPFSDNVSLLEEFGGGYIGAAHDIEGSNGSCHGQHAKYTSNRSRFSYSDPFADPAHEEKPDQSTTGRAQQMPNIRTVDLTYPMETHILSPLTENTSSNNLSYHEAPTSSSSIDTSHDYASPFGSSSRITSNTSQEYQRSLVPLASGITSSHIHRSDTWWSRFSRTAFLDRRGSDASRSGKMVDIRDPNPPPKLVAIEEGSPPEPVSLARRSSGCTKHLTRRDSRPYGTHGKSISSLKTAGTADSEAIERMAGAMDVVQRAPSRTHQRSGSASTLSIDTRTDNRSWVQYHGDIDSIQGGVDVTVSSPVDMTLDDGHPTTVQPRDLEDISFQPALPPAGMTTTQPHSPPLTTPITTPITPKGSVAARVHAFERRFSQAQDLPSPTNTKHREERARKNHPVNYGLVPRPSLFVANPDHRSTPSTGS